MLSLFKTVFIVLIFTSVFGWILFQNQEDVKKNRQYIPIYTDDISMETYSSLIFKYRHSIFKEMDVKYTQANQTYLTIFYKIKADLSISE